MIGVRWTRDELEEAEVVEIVDTRFRLMLRADGYYWLCPTCGYCEEKAICVDEPTGEQRHLQAGEGADGLLVSVLGFCRNCQAQVDRTRRMG